MKSPKDLEFFFRGSGTVMQPHHMTRYIYPSYCGYPLSCLRLQTPANSASRTRPQGSGSWGTDGHTFLTITPSGRPHPTQVQFDAWVVGEKARDKSSANPLGRAMRRVSGYQGNTTLESGKFVLEKGQGLVYVVKRTTMVPLGGKDKGKFGRDEDVYTIKVGDWYNMRPPMEEGREHDSWWMRLHDLFQGKFDRAFFHAKENLDVKLGIRPPIIKWRRRKDIEQAVEIFTKSPLPKGKIDPDESCISCGDEWFTESEVACRLKCGHFYCLECVTTMVDIKTGRGNLFDSEPDPKTKFFRCPTCRNITPIHIDRTAVIIADELYFWRWKVSMRFLEREAKDNWLMRLNCMVLDGWIRELPEGDHNAQEEKARTYVRHQDAVEFMQKVPMFVSSLLPYGFGADNPVDMKEGVALAKHLEAELQSLAQKRTIFSTRELIAHMEVVGKKAVKPVLVSKDKSERLGNPEFPPGYIDYRKFLCEWTARGCFLSPIGKMEVMSFMSRMGKEKGAWWKDERAVWFDP